MGQLLGIPAGTRDGSHDSRPTNMSECFINGKVDGQRLLHFQNRSNEESDNLAELLFRNSLLQDDTPEGRSAILRRGIKRKRRQKEVVTYTDPDTGVRCRLHPRMSLW